MALSLVFVIVKALTISSMINATFCLHCWQDKQLSYVSSLLHVTFSCLVIERTRIVFVLRAKQTCWNFYKIAFSDLQL